MIALLPGLSNRAYKNLPSNGERYLQVGGRGQCLGAGKLEATLREMLAVGAADSHMSGDRVRE